MADDARTPAEYAEEVVWQDVLEACHAAWPDKKKIHYNNSPIELIYDIINERDEAYAKGAADEREACARIAENTANATIAVCGTDSPTITQQTLIDVLTDFGQLQASAIRARSEKGREG